MSSLKVFDKLLACRKLIADKLKLIGLTLTLT